MVYNIIKRSSEFVFSDTSTTFRCGPAPHVQFKKHVKQQIARSIDIYLHTQSDVIHTWLAVPRCDTVIRAPEVDVRAGWVKVGDGRLSKGLIGMALLC